MYYVICTNYINGYHKWSGAPEHLSYLRNKHRHAFIITTKVAVEHSDRDIEVNELQNKINDYFRREYVYDNEVDFGDMSCEMIAREICDKFNAEEVLVLEDGINGAGYTRRQHEENK